MTQRSMILSLFLDYCDAEFYNSFKSCDDQNLPYMSDELDILLDKLNKVTLSKGYICPTRFEKGIG